MAGRLVTVAAFDQVTQAYVARNALGAAGISAVVTDEEAVTMLWQASLALGGIKVQVLEEDADRALAVLDDKFGADDGATPAAAGEGPEPPAASAEEPRPPTPPGAVAAPGEREEYARRLFFIAWFGLAFPPIAFVALFFLLNGAFGQGELSPRGRFNLFVGGLLVAAGMVLFMFFCAGFGGAFR